MSDLRRKLIALADDAPVLIHPDEKRALAIACARMALDEAAKELRNEQGIWRKHDERIMSEALKLGVRRVRALASALKEG